MSELERSQLERSELERSELERSEPERTPERVEVFELTENPDPISGEPGSHPLGTGIGAAATGAVATAIGATAGPIGAIAGAVVGSVIGGLVGKSAAENANPSGEVVVSELDDSDRLLSPEVERREARLSAEEYDRAEADRLRAERQPVLSDDEYDQLDSHPSQRGPIV